METHTLTTIAKRRSHRKYLPDQLSEVQLEALIQAALQSPSAVNRQPWHFSVVQDQELLSVLNRAVWEAVSEKDPSQRGPRFSDPDFHVFYHAPTVIFLSAPPSHYAPIDCGIAVENIVLAAESLGLGSVILGMPGEAFAGKRKEELERSLRFPVGSVFQIAVALGVPDDDKPPHPVGPDKVSFLR